MRRVEDGIIAVFRFFIFFPSLLSFFVLPVDWEPCSVSVLHSRAGAVWGGAAEACGSAPPLVQHGHHACPTRDAGEHQRRDQTTGKYTHTLTPLSANPQVRWIDMTSRHTHTHTLYKYITIWCNMCASKPVSVWCVMCVFFVLSGVFRSSC